MLDLLFNPAIIVPLALVVGAVRFAVRAELRRRDRKHDNHASH